MRAVLDDRIEFCERFSDISDFVWFVKRAVMPCCDPDLAKRLERAFVYSFYGTEGRAVAELVNIIFVEVSDGQS